MNPEKKSKSKLSQEVAEQVLQVYTKSLQDHKCLKSILSEYAVLDYFGKMFYGCEKVSSHLIANLHGCNYELSSLNINDQPPSVDWNPVTASAQEKSEDELGVNLISPPKMTFPGLTFTTPVRCPSRARRRTASEASIDNCNNSSSKILKKENNRGQSSSTKGAENTQQNHSSSPQTFQTVFPSDVRYLTAFGTIRYPKRVLPTIDPKKIKHSLSTLRDRYCQLFIEFECDEHAISVTNCKIWTIKYTVSSRVAPRNLLKAFDEVDVD